MHKKLLQLAAKLLLGFMATIIVSQPILATGETYHWKDSGQAVLVGEGGSYTSPVELQHGSDTANSAIFETTYKGGCPGNTDLKLHAEIALTDYKKIDPAHGTVQAAGCTVALDSSFTVGGAYSAVSANPSNAQNTASAQSLHTANSCKADTIGYLICPIYKLLLNVVEEVETGVILPFLKVDPLPLGANASISYKVWSAVRDLADVFLVIAFLILIFAHTMSLSVDSYSIKKLLPRVIAAAVLIQFSYTLVALGVDAANIIGAGIGQIVLKPIQGVDTAYINGVTGSLGIGALIAGAVALSGGVVVGSIFIALIGAFFTVILVFLTLVARQILITFLLIMAPLAFAAWILPNTEHYFRMWHRSLTRLLLMYPLIVVLFASGKIFGAVTTAGVGTGHGFGSDTMRSIVSIVANLVPLFLIPATFRLAGAALESSHKFIRLLHGGTKVAATNSSTYERMKTRAGQRKTELAAGQKIKFLGANVGGTGFGVLGTGPGGLPSLATKKSREASHARAMANFSRERSVWDKRLDDEGFTYEGLEVLSKGSAHGAKKINDARTAGDTVSLNNWQAGLAEASRYINISAARTAALKARDKMGVTDDGDRTALLDYAGNSGAGKLIARQAWNSAREGSRKGSVHLAFTDVNGNVNAAELKKFVVKQNIGTWSNYSKDAYEVMARPTGTPAVTVLRDMATTDWTQRQLLVNLLGPRGAAPEQQAIIRKVLQDTRHLAPPPPPPI